MFTKSLLRLAKWQLVLAALGQQVTAKDTAEVCFGKAVKVREKEEREASPRKLVPGVGQNQGVHVRGEKSRWERTWGRSAALTTEEAMCVLREGMCKMHGKDIAHGCVSCKHLCTFIAETQMSTE